MAFNNLTYRIYPPLRSGPQFCDHSVTSADVRLSVGNELGNRGDVFKQETSVRIIDEPRTITLADELVKALKTLKAIHDLNWPDGESVFMRKGKRIRTFYVAGNPPARVQECFAVCCSLDKSICISESAAASPLARSAVI